MTTPDGPWIYASACAVAAVDGKTGRLIQVGCPSRMCPPGLLVPLDEHARITRHDGLIPGDCPFIGYRVVPDPGVDLKSPERRRDDYRSPA